MARDASVPGSASDGGQGKDDGWSADGSLPEDLQIKTPADSVEATTEQETPEEEQESEPEEKAEEAEGEEEEEGAPAPAKKGVKAEEAEEPEEAEDSDTQRSLAEVQGKLSQMEKMLQFYQQGYNDLLNQSKGAQPPQEGEQAAKGKPAPQGQAEIDAELQAPPPEWKTSEDVVQYFDKRNQSLIKREIGNAVKQYVGEIDKSFQRVNQAIHTFIDRSIKPQVKDFDDVIKDVNNELFVLDPTGQNIVGYRNQALLQYFQSQPIPILAMYDYGVSKRAPQTIKKAAQEATKKTVQKLTKRPKATTQIRGGASSEQIGELDWDTPKEKVEQLLHKKRLI